MIVGGTEPDVKRISNGMTELGTAAIEKALTAYREDMVDPLLARMLAAGTGDDHADAVRLLDDLPAIFDQMDDAALVDMLAPALAQAGAIGIASVTPDPKKLDHEPEIFEPTNDPFEEPEA